MMGEDGRNAEGVYPVPPPPVDLKGESLYKSVDQPQAHKTPNKEEENEASKPASSKLKQIEESQNEEKEAGAPKKEKEDDDAQRQRRPDLPIKEIGAAVLSLLALASTVYYFYRKSALRLK